jgi:PAS domain S-box-containing protein
MKPSDHDEALKNQVLSLEQQAVAPLQKNDFLSLQSFEQMSLDEQYSLFSELEAHQIELEMHNAALHQMAVEHLRYLDLYNHAPIGYCSVSENEQIIQTNFTAAKLLGLLPSEMCDTQITAYIFKEDQDMYYFFRQQLKISNVPHSCELRMIKKDGRMFWAKLVGDIKHGSWQLPELRLVIKDATERRQNDKVLFESGQKYQFLFDKSTFGIADCKIVYDSLGVPIDYQFLDVNQAYINMIGINPGCKTATQVFPDIKSYDFDWISVFATVAHTGKQVCFEQIFEFDSCWYEYIVYQSKRDHFVVMQMDITERKHSEKKQQQHNEQLSQYSEEIKQIYHNAPCGYLSLDINGFFLHINQTALNWLGYSKDEMINKFNFCDLLLSQSLESFQQSYLQFQQYGKERDLEIELIRKDGTIFSVLISSSALYDANGYFLMSRSTLYDITERKKIEEERILHSKEQALAASHLVATQEKLRQQFSSELHDRTSPNLAAIAINLKVIASEILPESNICFLECMEDTLALIADTTLSIREICTDMRPPLLDYAGLTSAIENYAQQVTKRTGIAVQFNVFNKGESVAPEVESMLFRICQEAMTNFLKHANATSIMITLNFAPIISLIIMDNGIGFDFELLGRRGCVGLGLLSMREMAIIIEGKFLLESALGKGTRIEVCVTN